MKLLYEQFDVDAAIKTVAPVKPTTTVVTKPTDTTKPIDNTDKTNKFDQAKKQHELDQYKAKLIQNSVIFYEAMLKELSDVGGTFNDLDEERVYKLISKYIIPNQAQYIDMLIRIMFEPTLIQSRRKHAIAYDYWLSRNKQSGTTFAFLENLQNQYMRRLDYIFNGDIGDWLDFDTTDNPIIIKLKKQLIPIYPSIMKYVNNNKHMLKMNGRYTTQEIEKRVLDAYKNNIFGKPKK